MQVLCIAANNDAADISCQVCGHQYKLYFSRPSRTERLEAIARVEQALADHHTAGEDRSVHPEGPFNVPEWSGRAEWSAAALLGGAPSVAA
jgi:hypothetical protein